MGNFSLRFCALSLALHFHSLGFSFAWFVFNMRRITSWNFQNNFTVHDFIAIRYSWFSRPCKDCVTRRNILRKIFMFTTKTVTTKEIVVFSRKSSTFYFRLYYSSPEEALSTPLFWWKTNLSDIWQTAVLKNRLRGDLWFLLISEVTSRLHTQKIIFINSTVHT